MAAEISNEQIYYQWEEFSLEEKLCKFPDGEERAKIVLRHPGAALVIPQTSNGDLVLVKQYRAVMDEWLLEFPAGKIVRGETALDCAQRELGEEVCLYASHLHFLARVYAEPGYSDEVISIFFARGLKPRSLVKDEDEFISVCTMSIQEFQSNISSGNVRDAKTLSAFAIAICQGVLWRASGGKFDVVE
ncbi:hypothetical protein BLL42_05515 [Pseudomonas frederiksbergensis]|uniref:GDP-mannose pyrophosphatase n=1 Tax=Pseudomonas frederiksbergensis TaxID=104087 RepID=A0A1J0EHA8_9PSED|nr:NUDIX hydrolase [Pseudomonas frederiksbergensis]APC15204.1 hypothetical protein BLL42_05515 [Pseudomonas frederiksbergensis]